MYQKKKIQVLYLLLLAATLVATIFLSLSIGEISIPLGKLPQIIADRGSTEHDVLFYIRIPRTLLGFAIGGSLSLAGAILREFTQSAGDIHLGHIGEHRWESPCHCGRLNLHNLLFYRLRIYWRFLLFSVYTLSLKGAHLT